jgi:hypothetical protein
VRGAKDSDGDGIGVVMDCVVNHAAAETAVVCIGARCARDVTSR